MVNHAMLLIFIISVYHDLIQLYSETLPSLSKHFCWIYMPRVDIFFFKRTLEMSSPLSLSCNTLAYSSQSSIWRLKTPRHSPISHCSGKWAWLWISTVPVRLYWNWKQFSLRRQGRTWESSAHALELREGLSRWRVLLCIVWGSHDWKSKSRQS